MAKNADILTFLIAKNENIPLNKVEEHIEKALIEANEEGIIVYRGK